MRLTPTMLSSPGLTGRSSNHRPGYWIASKSDVSDFDNLNAEVGQARLRVKPGNDMLGQPNPLAQKCARPDRGCPGGSIRSMQGGWGAQHRSDMVNFVFWPVEFGDIGLDRHWCCGL